MSRLWEIREKYGNRMDGQYGEKSAEDFETPEEQEAFECGYEEGYGAAMEEAQQMGQRMGHRGNMGMRMGYRRGRDSMGRYR